MLSEAATTLETVRYCIVDGCGQAVQGDSTLYCLEHQSMQTWKDLEVRAKVLKVSLPKLTVDRRFQAPLSEKRVMAIITNFNPDLLDVLTISQRKNEQVVLDGQHRWQALLRMGIGRADAKVFTGLTYSEEAWIFARLNMDRRQPDKLLSFRALAEAGNTPQAEARSIVQSFGYRLADSIGRYGEENEITCAGTIENVHKMGLLGPTMEVISTSWPGLSGSLHTGVIMGVAAFFAMWPEADHKHLLSALKRTKFSDLWLPAKSKAIVNKDHRLWVHFMYELYEAYNYKQQVNKLEPKRLPTGAPKIWGVTRDR